MSGVVSAWLWTCCLRYHKYGNHMVVLLQDVRCLVSWGVGGSACCLLHYDSYDFLFATVSALETQSLCHLTWCQACCSVSELKQARECCYCVEQARRGRTAAVRASAQYQQQISAPVALTRKQMPGTRSTQDTANISKTSNKVTRQEGKSKNYHDMQICPPNGQKPD